MTGYVGEATEHSVISEHPITGPGAAAHRVQDGEPDGEHDRLYHADNHPISRIAASSTSRSTGLAVRKTSFCRRRVRATACGPTYPRPRFRAARHLSAQIGAAFLVARCASA